MPAPQINTILLGNQGVGKSHLLNILLGTEAFPSGISIGTSLTRTTTALPHSDALYTDTPGFYDPLHSSTQQLSRALSHAGPSKIIFVATLEDGRVRGDDLAALHVIVTAVELTGVDMKNRYSLLLNKCTPAEMLMLRGHGLETVRLAFSKVRALQHVGFLPMGVKDRSELAAFVLEAPFVVLSGQRVLVDLEEFEQTRDQLVEEVVRQREAHSAKQDEPRDLVRADGALSLEARENWSGGIEGRAILQMQPTEHQVGEVDLQRAVVDAGKNVGRELVERLFVRDGRRHS